MVEISSDKIMDFGDAIVKTNFGKDKVRVNASMDSDEWLLLSNLGNEKIGLNEGSPLEVNRHVGEEDLVGSDPRLSSQVHMPISVEGLPKKSWAEIIQHENSLEPKNIDLGSGLEEMIVLENRHVSDRAVDDLRAMGLLNEDQNGLNLTHISGNGSKTAHVINEQVQF
ncbi:hypothetical protein V6N13_113498 [Hibiscus sabdariffa]|uniref:Uncharacterized protein n=1 Tax=Hibiscus sabdariffa TaxID=183260 RepID=A0ABR2CUS4_9ROSI